MDKIKRIFMWSGPRNISTTMMYSFAQRADTKVYDEPLYGAYLKETAAKAYHPGADEILNSMETEAQQVVDMMIGSHEEEVVFFKNMTHHLMNLDKAFTKQGFNIMLTRNPKEMIPSFAKVIPELSMKDIGYAEHLELMEYFDKHDIPYAVLDAKNVLLNPEGVLKKLCEKAGIDFDKAMLSWPAGTRPEDGVWAKYWYASVHASTGFKKYETKDEQFPAHLEALLNECMPYYKKLENLALT
jgi:hypothetical protein